MAQMLPFSFIPDDDGVTTLFNQNRGEKGI